jgi:hypothetical protein
VAKIALTGGAYLAHSVIASAQRSVNLYSEPVPEAQGEPMPAAHYPTPGLRRLGTTAIGTGPIRGIRQCTTGGVYVVSGSNVYSINVSDWTGTLLGTITPGLRTPVSMADNGLDLVIVDGTASGWRITLADNTFAQITDPEGMFSGATRVDYLDTFLIFNKPATPQFYWTGSLALTFDTLDFANKQSYSDMLVTLIVAKREIWLLGERTSEVWYDAGPTDIGAGSSQFAQVQSVFIDHGIAAKYSVANYDNGIFWLTRDRQGQGFVIHGAGYQTKRISTYAIEAEIAGYTRIDDAIGFCYQLGGHTFYVLTFPHADRTWVHDITTGLWHEWLWIDSNGNEHRHRANCFWPVNSTLVVGDWQNGNLYALDRTVFTDNGQPIKRLRSFPHLVAEGKRVFYRSFIADMETGTTPQGDVVITEEKIITWLPNIAQLNGVNVGAVSVNFGGAFIDWERGFIYIVGQHGYQKYTTALETQTPLVTVSVPDPDVLWAIGGGFVDPVGGYLILQSGDGPHSSTPISKHDPNTFAVVDTFGALSGSFLPYPTGVTIADRLTGVVCNGVTFGFIKYSIFSGVVSGFRVDTMEHTGFSQAIVSGATNNRGSMIAGKSGGSSASVFLSWDATTTIKPSIPLYRIDIAASATSYDPAAWPATNPGITWTTVGSLDVSAVDPAWTGITLYSFGYDQADGNVLMMVGTQNIAQGYHVLKLNAQTAAVMWNIAIGTTTSELETSRINGTLWMFRNPGAGAGPTTSYRINTLTGTMETQPLSGVFAQSGTNGPQFDSETTTMFYGGTFNAGASAPNPVEGTSTFSSGWAWMGGQTIRTTVTATDFHDRLVSLRWSDDRGHAWGSPVSQSIGDIGEYRTSLLWQRLGMTRDRNFEISWSVPMPTALQGCWIEVTPAQS